MKLEFAHENVSAGNESFSLHFDTGHGERNVCVLVDAGRGTNVERHLGGDEQLGAILLTHAHLDHYSRLKANRFDGAPIVCSPETADALEVVEPRSSYNEYEGALRPTDDWFTIHPGIAVHPVPAGHNPGACGFVVRFETGSKAEYVYVTGDWSTETYAGWEGADPDGIAIEANVGAMFLTAAKNDSYRDELREALSSTLLATQTGGPTLVAASSGQAVQMAHLIDAASRNLDVPAVVDRVIMTGQAAKHYEATGADTPNIETYESFDGSRVEEYLANDAVTIASPASFSDDSPEMSSVLFEAIRDDPSATLIRMSHRDPSPAVTGASATVKTLPAAAHPTEEQIDDMIRAIDPIEMIVTHRPPRRASSYKTHSNNYGWVDDTLDRHEIYDGGWLAPPWLSSASRSTIRNAHNFDTAGPADEWPEFPKPRRTMSATDSDALAREGVDPEALASRMLDEVGDSEQARALAGASTRYSTTETDQPVTSEDRPGEADATRVYSDAERIEDRTADVVRDVESGRTPSLTNVKKVGEDRADLLAEAGYESIEDLLGATLDDLLEVEDIGPAVARNLVYYTGAYFAALDGRAGRYVEPAEVEPEPEPEPAEASETVEETPESAVDELERRTEPVETTGLQATDVLDERRFETIKSRDKVEDTAGALLGQVQDLEENLGAFVEATHAAEVEVPTGPEIEGTILDSDDDSILVKFDTADVDAEFSSATPISVTVDEDDEDDDGPAAEGATTES